MERVFNVTQYINKNKKNTKRKYSMKKKKPYKNKTNNNINI